MRISYHLYINIYYNYIKSFDDAKITELLKRVSLKQELCFLIIIDYFYKDCFEKGRSKKTPSQIIFINNLGVNQRELN